MNHVPETTIVTALTTGITTVKNNPDVLDWLLKGLDPDELAVIKTEFATRFPSVILNFPRSSDTFPCYAVVMGSEAVIQDYVGQGQERLDEDDVAFLGDEFEDYQDTSDWRKRRLSGTFTVYVMAEHPAWTVALYRIARAIVGAASPKWFNLRGLEEPTMSGADLAPDPRYLPESIFVRILTLTFEYEEVSLTGDPLGQAFDASFDRLSLTGTLNIKHEDSEGGVHPEDE